MNLNYFGLYTAFVEGGTTGTTPDSGEVDLPFSKNPASATDLGFNLTRVQIDSTYRVLTLTFSGNITQSAFDIFRLQRNNVDLLNLESSSANADFSGTNTIMMTFTDLINTISSGTNTYKIILQVGGTGTLPNADVWTPITNFSIETYANKDYISLVVPGSDPISHLANNNQEIYVRTR